MTTTRMAALAFAILGLSAGPSLAATCHMTVQGVPVIDDQDCSVAGRGGDIRVDDEAGDVVRIRRSAMSARFASGGPADGRGRYVPLGQTIASDGSDGETCYFGQKAVLCVGR